MGGPGSGIGNRSRTGMPKSPRSGRARTVTAIDDEVDRLTIWIGKRDKQGLKEIAARRGITLAALIREAVSDWLEQELSA